jgi:hypothetical protein
MQNFAYVCDGEALGFLALIPLAIKTSTATLAAAAVAAVAATLSLLVTTVAAYRREGREAQRAALQPHLAALADGIHQTVATSFTQQKALAAGSRDTAAKWRKLGQDASGELERIRLEIRYPLPGLDDGLRNLTRVPAWVGHRKGQADGDELLAKADALARALHRAIETSWRRGRPPGWIRRHQIARKVRALRSIAPIGPKVAADVADVSDRRLEQPGSRSR